MENITDSSFSPAFLPPAVEVPFYEADHSHKIGRFINGNMHFEKKIRLSDDKKSVLILTENPQIPGDFSIVDKRYDIQSYVRIRFVLEGGYYYLKLQSDRHGNSNELTDHTLSMYPKNGVGLCPRPTGQSAVLYFIGADDIRPARTCQELWEVSRSGDKSMLLGITVFVSQGGIVEIKYNANNNISFRCNNFQTTPP